MKRSCESSLSDENTDDKEEPFSINLSTINNVPLESIEISDAVMDLPPECATEVIHSNGESQISQDDEDSLVAESGLGVLVEFMDITEPLTKLRSLLEQRTGMDLSDYHFYLQDTQELDPSKNLVNQCVQGEGLVQINVEISDKEGLKKINIIDVLKPLDDIPTSPSGSSSIGEKTYMEFMTNPKHKGSNPQYVTRWFVSPEFKRLQEKYKIPPDPALWTTKDVKVWFEWASSHFNVPDVDYSELDLTGPQLLDVNYNSVLKKALGSNSGDLFWTHLELLRRFKIVSVLEQAPSLQSIQCDNASTTKNPKRKPPRIGAPRIAHEGSPGYSGQIQLWQFLLELLTDKEYRNFIQWVGNEGEFKLTNPEMVAQLWGQRKNKPTMNYEKLSRALRYYYDGEMIAKVHGKRFVYKFVYDLKSLLGYDASQLNRLVTECALKQQTSRIVSFPTADSSISS